MRQLGTWKKLWWRSLTRSHKRTSLGPSRSRWNGATSALQPGEITSKGREFHLCSINKNAHTKKVWKVIVCSLYIYIYMGVVCVCMFIYHVVVSAGIPLTRSRHPSLSSIVPGSSSSVVYRDEINHKNNAIYIQTQADSFVSGTNGVLISDFGRRRREERDTILTMSTPPQRSAHLVIRKTQLRLSKVKIQLPTAEYPTLASMVQSQLTLFQNPQIFRTISSEPDIIHTPAHFLSGGLLWQMVIKLHPMTQSFTKLIDEI